MKNVNFETDSQLAMSAAANLLSKLVHKVSTVSINQSNQDNEKELLIANEISKNSHSEVSLSVVHNWLISALLGLGSAFLSICVDVSFEYLYYWKIILYENFSQLGNIYGFVTWVGFIVLLVTLSALTCKFVSEQAIGSGIPEVKVIMNGFDMPNYLSIRTLIAKFVGITLALSSGLPIGKEGPFVHMGAIMGAQLTKLSKTWHDNAFFCNEMREIQNLAAGCAIGIACTFSAPVGGVLYGIESTHTYFAVKKYWRLFFATTCSAILYRVANNFIMTPNSNGIMAYFQTNFPNNVFVVEEFPVFIIIGILSGISGAAFVFLHRQISLFMKKNQLYRAIFPKQIIFTIFMAFFVGILTFPSGFGKYTGGKLNFRDALIDFMNNCTLSKDYTNICDKKVFEKWNIYSRYSIFPILIGYLIENYFLIAICISLYIPAGVFIPSFAIGACGGRLVGEFMVYLFPSGIRGHGGPFIYPGLYAVVGAAAYTGAVTHSLSIAVIVFETTGQLCGLLPVLPSIYESVIRIKNYPHLSELPPSRLSVHLIKVEQIMVKEIVYITKHTKYNELRKIMMWTPKLESYPLVNNNEEKILIGSIARKHLSELLKTYLGSDPSVFFVADKNNKEEFLHYNENSYRRKHYQNYAKILKKRIDLSDDLIDSTPYQLALGTSLYEVHKLFSLIGLCHAYVTDRGKLMGVVALKELHKSLEHVHFNGALSKKKYFIV